MSPPQKPPKLRHACNECHASKVRCSGERTGCRRCVYNQQKCTYSVSMVGKVQGHRRRAAVTGTAPRSGAQSLNINTSTEIISVANADVIHDEANGNDLNSKPNDVPVESSEGITSSPAHCSILPGGNNGKVTTSSAPENFSTSLESIDTSSLETPIIEHEFSWDFSSDERADALNSLALENPSNVDSMKNPEYGDFEYDFSIHEVPATSSSQDDSRSPKRQIADPIPISPVPKFYPSRKRTHSDLSEKQAQHAQNDLRWRSQSQSYKRPTISTQHHNHSFSREMYEYPESSASFDADCSFDRGSTSHSTTSQTNMNHQSMNRIPQTTQSNRISFTAQSHYMVSSMSSSVTHYEASWRFTSKCFIIISKLQKLLRDSSSLSLDVILATNKSAISELAQMFDSTLASNTARSTSPEDFFSIHSEIQPSNTCDTSLSTDFIPLMVYMIALKCIHDLYSQACFIFTQDDHRSRSLSTPSPRNTPSTSNSPFSNPFGLPQLDFGTFKIDIADQRRLFSEIIARELGNCLSACTRLRSYFLMQPGDISTSTGLIEEMFLGIEEGLQSMIKRVKI
ncbi:Bcboa13 [Botrytis cinerea B05.10]|uniref:C6 finger domain transcription factor BOA13 n=2 Tax=Botryotinia fuckeliana (strain B05.10) TaxID=332648 RepID=BOA13_BOTFB|nr:Bcboa13 [Botrytis cinerea B05.10]G0LEU0.1 RecName: Full=C6 finger domain transcription factor BOA13; AltName: Full=Botcinic acid biosynthesis cluster B protein 13 [Botrytis cinerea B05.10]ATZ45190.1 Bcboa13 [Botrytis cinerea B05.10]CBX87035.1 BcBOA13 protein [Botrytis cinerea B05.10]